MSLLLSGSDGLSDVDGTAATPAIRGTDANTGIFFPAADTIAFSEGGAEVARFDSSGNLGIGTNAPNHKLVVANSAATYIQASNTSGTPSNIFVGAAGADNVIISRDGTTGDKPLSFYIGTAERARIDSSGNLLVGKTTSSVTTSPGVTIVDPDVSNTGVTVTSASGTGADSGFQMYSTGAAAYRFYVTFNGQVFATNTTITGISDVRLKENIRDLDDGLEKVMALQPRKFDWKEGKGAGIKNARGFIAQEFETVFPDMIDEWKDPSPLGEEPYKAVNANLIPTLVKAIQEQQAIITQQQATISAMETRLAALEA